MCYDTNADYLDVWEQIKLSVLSLLLVVVVIVGSNSSGRRPVQGERAGVQLIRVAHSAAAAPPPTRHRV